MAELDGEIVGTQAFIPVALVDRAGQYLSTKSEETLVSPSMRGKNLFHRMYEPLIAWAATHGVEYIWGFTPAKNAFEREGCLCPIKTSQLFRSFSTSAARRLRGAEPASRVRSAAEAVVSSALAAYGTIASRLRQVDSRGEVEIHVFSTRHLPGRTNCHRRSFVNGEGRRFTVRNNTSTGACFGARTCGHSCSPRLSMEPLWALDSRSA